MTIKYLILTGSRTDWWINRTKVEAELVDILAELGKKGWLLASSIVDSTAAQQQHIFVKHELPGPPPKESPFLGAD